MRRTAPAQFQMPPSKFAVYSRLGKKASNGCAAVKTPHLNLGGPLVANGCASGQARCSSMLRDTELAKA